MNDTLDRIFFPLNIDDNGRLISRCGLYRYLPFKRSTLKLNVYSIMVDYRLFVRLLLTHVVGDNNNESSYPHNEA